MRKQRDYRAEYEARSERARAKGYTGYSQLRHIKEFNKETAEKVVDNLRSHGLLEYFDEDHDLFDTGIFWEYFRNAYGKGET